MTIQVEILQFLHYNPSSSRVEISAGLTEAPNERTLKRIIAELVQNGDVIVKGKGKATRYSLSAQAQLMMPLNIDTYFIKDIDELYGEYQAGADTTSLAPLTSYTFEDAEPGIVGERG